MAPDVEATNVAVISALLTLDQEHGGAPVTRKLVTTLVGVQTGRGSALGLSGSRPEGKGTVLASRVRLVLRHLEKAGLVERSGETVQVRNRDGLLAVMIAGGAIPIPASDRDTPKEENSGNS